MYRVAWHVAVGRTACSEIHAHRIVVCIPLVAGSANDQAARQSAEALHGAHGVRLLDRGPPSTIAMNGVVAID